MIINVVAFIGEIKAVIMRFGIFADELRIKIVSDKFPVQSKSYIVENGISVLLDVCSTNQNMIVWQNLRSYEVETSRRGNSNFSETCRKGVEFTNFLVSFNEFRLRIFFYGNISPWENRSLRQIAIENLQ